MMQHMMSHKDVLNGVEWSTTNLSGFLRLIRGSRKSAFGRFHNLTMVLKLILLKI